MKNYKLVLNKHRVSKPIKNTVGPEPFIFDFQKIPVVGFGQKSVIKRAVPVESIQLVPGPQTEGIYLKSLNFSFILFYI